MRSAVRKTENSNLIGAPLTGLTLLWGASLPDEYQGYSIDLLLTR
jgi:hypothetical protein